MALRLMKTLVEMRSEVLAACGLGVQGELTVDLHPQIDRFLRQAQTHLWQRFPVLRTRTRRAIPLEEDVTTYAFPDDFDLGSIEQVSVVNDDDREWTLEPGIRSSDRSDAATVSTAGDEPSRYDIYDGVIEVLRAPPNTEVTLYVTGYLGAAPLAEDTDRPNVDDEAMIGLATIELKKFKKMLTASEAMAEKQELENGYIADIDAAQGATDTFVLGGQHDDPNEAQVTRSRPWWLANRRP